MNSFAVEAVRPTTSPAQKKRQFASPKTSTYVAECSCSSYSCKNWTSHCFDIKNMAGQCCGTTSKWLYWLRTGRIAAHTKQWIDRNGWKGFKFWLPCLILKVRQKNGLQIRYIKWFVVCNNTYKEIDQTCLVSLANIQRTLDGKMKRLRSTGLGVHVKKQSPSVLRKRNYCGSVDI